MRAILTYHSIDDSGSVISIEPSTFASHIESFTSGGIEIVSLSRVLELTDESDAVALTFDDGFENFASEAWPRLQQAGLPATVFIATDHVGLTNDWQGRPRTNVPTLPLMQWETIARLAEHGVEIGSHTRSHPDLTSLDDASLREELEGSAETIRRRIGVGPTTLCYPYGSHSQHVSRTAGMTYSVACTTQLRGLRSDEDPLLLPRLDSYYFRSPGAFEAWSGRLFRLRIRLRSWARNVRRRVVFSLRSRIGLS